MTYFCEDCSYRGKVFPEGACPACGSRRVRRENTRISRQMRARKPYRLVLCFALWVWLIQEILGKL